MFSKFCVMVDGCPTQHQADGARSAPRVSGRDLWRMFSAKESVKPRSLCESLCGFKKQGEGKLCL
jgi:hypothetical protein